MCVCVLCNILNVYKLGKHLDGAVKTDIVASNVFIDSTEHPMHYIHKHQPLTRNSKAYVRTANSHKVLTTNQGHFFVEPRKRQVEKGNPSISK